MSVEESTIVDAIGVESESKKVVLTISDHLDWSDIERHETVLQEKVNTYLSFIESGELLETYPDARGRHAVVQVVARVAPPEDSRVFLDEVENILREAGVEFRVKVLGG